MGSVMQVPGRGDVQVVGLVWVAVGTVTLARDRPSTPVALAARDLVGVVVRLLDRPVDGLVHASGGSTPIEDAVAGCAG